MNLHVFNNSQKLIKFISNNDLISLVQEQELNNMDMLFVEIPKNVWRELKEQPFYVAVNDPYERFSYHMYKVSQETENVDSVEIRGVQVGFDELKSHGYIEDRRFSNARVSDAMSAIVDGTDWQVGYVDNNLPKVNTNFYFISRLEALSKLIENVGGEIRFRVEVSGNRIVAKRIDIYKQISKFKGKRFALGSNLIDVVKESDTSELYTALVGRGKGEELEDDVGDVTGAYGRRINFKEVEWKVANGDPVDKPLGQNYVEIPERTSLYGYPDGQPRTGIVEFTDTEEPAELLQQTYDTLVEVSRPQRQFKAVVETAGDMELGETVAIITPDFRYKTRVFKVKRDYLNNYYTEVEFGDKLTQSMGSIIKDIESSVDKGRDEIVNIIQTAANGKNKIFRGPDKPTSGMMKGDLWYKPVANGEYEMYIFDGDSWGRPVVSTGVNNEVDTALKKADLDIDKARKNIWELATDLEVGTSFYKLASDIGLANKNEDGTVNSIINLGDDGTAYIGGKNIVLDGDTVVSGSFTVTDSIFAEEMNISKFTVGTLNFAEVNGINMNIENVVGNLSNFVKSNWNAINSNLSVDGNKLRYDHVNGNYTELTADGLMRYDAGTKRKYHHRTKIIPHSTAGQGTNNVEWVALGREFDKYNSNEINVAVALSDTIVPRDSTFDWYVHRFVFTQAQGESMKKIGGQWHYPIRGYTSFGVRTQSGRNWLRSAGGLVIVTV